MKSKNVSEQIISRFDGSVGDTISNLKLQKLLYYAQGWSLACEGKALFHDDLQSWDHGPVVPDVYHHYKQFGWQSICLSYPAEKWKSPLLDAVVMHYGFLSGKRLEEMSHNETPWKSTYKKGKKNIVIPQELLADFFRNKAPQEEIHARFLQQLIDIKYQTKPLQQKEVWERLGHSWLENPELIEEHLEGFYA